MKKSIEAIWNEGFLKDSLMVVPKVNDLYNRKSIDLISQMMKMFRLNLIAITVAALVLLIVFVLIGSPLPGGLIFLLLIGICVYSKRQADRMREVDKGLNSYDYLMTFQQKLNEIIGHYTMIYRFVYPAVIVVFNLGLLYSDAGRNLIDTMTGGANPDVVHNLQVYCIAGTVMMAALISLFAGKIYRLDIQLVYGNVFKKLDDMIADMKELRR